MCDLPKFYSENLLVGFESSDDAAVYKINEAQAVIQTLDFFTPIVDDPYAFGSIAATNALSDVYAMGGQPTLAMNIVGFPNCLDPKILKEIMRGGADKVKEAGALLVGGHSIEDNEPKYGLSVMGLIHPNDVWKNIGANIGDALILTKPIGIGVLTTALKENMLSEQTINAIIAIMSTLNKIPVECIKDAKLQVNACTDITGFGLLGHAYEMASGSGITLEIESSKVPFIKEAFPLAEMGIIPAGAYKNRAHVLRHIKIEPALSEALLDLMFDPQTSGGLLIAMPHKDAEHLMHQLESKYPIPFSMIGHVVEKQEYALKII